MKWRLIDRIEDIEAWSSVQGRKTVSLEEYSLLAPLGRKGCLPESLVLESCVHLVRWLVVVSSEFRQSCLLLDVRRFSFEHETRPGDALSVSVKVLQKQEDRLTVACDVRAGGQRCGHGDMALSLVALGEISVAEDTRTLWRELYAKT